MVQRLLGNILGGFAPGANGLLAPRTQLEQPTQMPFKSYVGVLDGDAAYDTVAEVAAIIDAQAAGGIFELIWQMTIPAQQQIRWGFGSPEFQVNQGFMWFAALDITVGFQEGILRLVQANARETRVLTVLEVQTNGLHTQTNTTLATATPNDRNQQLALPEKVEFPKVGQDSLLQLWFRTTLVTTTVDQVGFQIPITIYQ